MRMVILCSARKFLLSESLRGPSDFNKYTIEFDGFLKVYNENSKSISFNDTGVRQGGLESSRFSASGRQEKAITEFNISFLFKVSPYIILNEYGNVLNTKDVKEYGILGQPARCQSITFRLWE